MKKSQILLLLAVFAWSAVQAEDRNTFYFTDAIVLPGETTSIELCMRNMQTDLTCVEAEIQLPEGLSVVRDVDGNPVVTLYRNRSVGHEVTTNVLENGNLKLLISSLEANRFGGEEGALLSFCVQAASTAPRGECTVETVGESLLVSTEAEAYYSVGVTGNVLITDDATSIHNPQPTMQTSPEAVYNLAGQRVGKKQKGINIINGRKELHK